VRGGAVSAATGFVGAAASVKWWYARMGSLPLGRERYRDCDGGIRGLDRSPVEGENECSRGESEGE
jgi:hypothetical protein